MEKFKCIFERFNEHGQSLYRILDANGFDAVGELVAPSDDFFNRKNSAFEFDIEPVYLIDVVLQMLDNPTVHEAKYIVSTVFKWNKGTEFEQDVYTDLDFFKECASLVISELKK